MPKSDIVMSASLSWICCLISVVDVVSLRSLALSCWILQLQNSRNFLLCRESG